MKLKKRVRDFKKYYENNLWVSIAIVILLILSLGLIEHYAGRLLICKCGYVSLWYNNANGPGNSQHLFDWYSFSHIIHGIIFFAILSLLFKKMPLRTKLIIAVIIECAWEGLENSPIIINRYRTATFSLDYYGDSIINSIFDVISMIVGFILAFKLKKWHIVAMVIFMELFTLYMIRDNLTLNIINLIYPTELIKNWQSAAVPLKEVIKITIFNKLFLPL
ncbi:Uncharacterised protein [uncultured archaeon]|nr:Uncharacterised protein [uncultured archaeon]